MAQSNTGPIWDTNAGNSTSIGSIFRNMSPEARMGLLQAGLGILANNTGHYGQAGPAIGKGGLLGVQGYNDSKKLGLLSDQQKSTDNFRQFQMDSTRKSQELAKQKYETEQANLTKMQGLVAQLTGATGNAAPINAAPLDANPVQQPIAPHAGVQGQLTGAIEPEINSFGLNKPTFADKQTQPFALDGYDPTGFDTPGLGIDGSNLTPRQRVEQGVQRGGNIRRQQFPSAGYETVQAPGQVGSNQYGAIESGQDRPTSTGSLIRDAQNKVGLNPLDLSRAGVGITALGFDKVGKQLQSHAALMESTRAANVAEGRARYEPLTGVLQGYARDTDTQQIVKREQQADGSFGFTEVGTEELTKLGLTAKEKGAPKTEINAYEDAITQSQKSQAKRIDESFASLSNAAPMLKNMAKAKELAKKARGLVGSFGETKLGIVKFFNNNLGTNIAPSQVTNAEALRGSLFIQVIENLRKVDATPSQAQQIMLQQALGNLGTDPDSIPAILDIYEDIIRGKVEIHNQMASQAKSSPAGKQMFLYDPVIQLPEKKATQDRAVNWDDL